MPNEYLEVQMLTRAEEVILCQDRQSGRGHISELPPKNICGSPLSKQNNGVKIYRYSEEAIFEKLPKPTRWISHFGGIALPGKFVAM